MIMASFLLCPSPSSPHISTTTFCYSASPPPPTNTCRCSSSSSCLLLLRPSPRLLLLRRPPNSSSLVATRTMRFCAIVTGELPVMSSFIKRVSDQALQATEGRDSTEEQGDADEESVTNESLRASIRRSKQVLAMHKNLLQQIAERKKLISILKDSAVHKEQEPHSDQHDSSFSHLDAARESKELGYSRRRHSQQSEASSSSTNPYVSAHGESLGGWKENSEYLEGKHSDADVVRMSSDGNYERSQYDSLSPKIYEPETTNDVKRDYFAETQISHASEKKELIMEEINGATSPLAGNNVMNVILVAAECAPWSKTGGLGDVAGALPKALARRGHRVMVVAPRYGNYAEPQEIGEHRRYKVAGQDMEIIYHHAYMDGVDFVFLDSPIFRHVESDVYGGNRMDILKRMVLLCKAAVEVPWHVPCGGYCYGDGNLVFIANDWHTALLPVYLKAYYRDNGFMIYARSVLVIHNIAHQGRGPIDDFNCLDLPGHYMDLFKLYDPFGGDHLNIFAAGIRAADRLVTVSHGYAWELKTPEGGWGLHGIINESDWKFQGIVNGIDTNDWNPKYDVHLKSDGYTNYSLETLQMGKAQCKAALQRELGLPVRGDVPVIAFIGRLDHQKGVDLIAEAMPWIAGQDAQLIMLGTGRQDLEDTLRRLESQHYDRVRGWVGFSVKLAHRMTAGADILLMPSRFEPCGLNQLYAMMYGTVPVVHAVGGLRDTVHHYNPYEEMGLGWTFERAEANRMIDALGHCLNTYRNYKNSWEGLQKRGMMQDLSWDNAAKLYEEVLVAAKYQW